MNIIAEIQPTGTTPEGFAPINLLKEDDTRLCQLDLQYSTLAPLRQSNARAMDFLLLANAVYSVDKLILRTDASDLWTRELSLVLPVSDVAIWNTVKRDLDACLSFLTGDLWNIDFVRQESTLIRPIRRRRHRHRVITPFSGDVVCLFSGGLDSLIGTIDCLEAHPEHRLVVVGHHDGQIAGPYADQRKLLGRLRPNYPGRIRPILTRVGHNCEETKEREITLRPRSLVFIALGIFVASALGPTIPLLIPENGTIALNVPLTPSRRGSCSTRTAHPYYLRMITRILTSLGLTNPLSNPLEEKTKGEAVVQCLNEQLVMEVVRLSVSCAKRGHKASWTHRNAGSCGRCMPCIYRRAALHKAGRDDELYGDDFCVGEVRLDDNGEKPNDVRACLSFLRRNPSLNEISKLLLSNGSLEISQLPSYAGLVQRTMDEIRSLLRDKASLEIRNMAGV